MIKIKNSFKMKRNQIELILIAFLFHLISNEIVDVTSNLAEIELKDSSSLLFYDFPEPNKQEDKSIYFFFKIIETNYYGINIKVIYEYEKEDELSFNGKELYYLEITNVASQRFMFNITKYTSETIKMIFIDNSREININLDNLFALDLKLEEIPIQPLPLIFNIDSIVDKTFIINYDKESYLEYCIDNGYDCFFQSFNEVYFEKGKKYKVKLNSFIEIEHTFDIPFLVIIKEIEFGARILKKNQKTEMIFIINTKDNDMFNLYLKNNNDNNNFEYSTAFINDYQKEHLLEINDDDINLVSRISNSKIEITKYDSNYNYLLIIISDYMVDGFFCTFNDYYTFNNYFSNQIIEIQQGKSALIFYEKYSYSGCKKVLVSSIKNMAILDSFYKFSNLTNILIFINNKYSNYDEASDYIYVNPSNEKKTILKIYDFKNLDNVYFKLYSHSLFKDNKIASFFKRTFSHSMYLGTNVYYLFDLNEEYYLFLKKYYGKIEFYQYNGDLNSLTEISQFNKPIENYGHESKYKLINTNELILLKAYEVISFYNTYNSLFDIYVQKVEDSQFIEINPYEYQFNNVVKLLKAGKHYFIKFTVDHLIKLDNQFLGATVNFICNGKSYKLNNEKRVIIDLEGDNIEVESDQNALIYFYKRIENKDIKAIVYDKNQKLKNMKFTVTKKNYNVDLKVGIIKDFCFQGYYPMISNKNNAHYELNGNKITIYIENLYDKLESQLYEKDGEEFIIYVYNIYDESGNPHFYLDNFDVGEPEYIDNLITPRNKYNFEVIPPKTNGNIIFDSIEKKELIYQIFMCKNKKVTVKINKYNQIIETSMNRQSSEELNNKEYESLVYTFDTEYEFLFAYFFNDEVKYDEDGKENEDNSSQEYENTKSFFGIKEDPIYINEIDNNKIFIRIKLDDFERGWNNFYIIIAKNDSFNNIETFSDPCYLAKLLIKNSNSIIAYSDYAQENNYISGEIDVSKLNIHAKDVVVVSVINNNLFQNNYINFIAITGKSIVDKKQPKMFNLGEKVIHLSEENNYFYCHFSENNPKKVFFYFSDAIKYIFFKEPDKDIQILSSGEYNILEITFSKIGNYYFEFKNFHGINVPAYYFSTFVEGKTYDIDLNKNVYYNDIPIISKSEIEQTKYKITNLNEDKYIFFYYKEDWASINPFEVCNEEANSCEKNVVKYHFLKNKKYTININCDKANIYNDDYYILNTFSFFNVRQNNIEEKKDNGFFLTNQPKIYYINLENNIKNKEQHLFIHHENFEIIYISMSDSEINPKQIYELTDYSYYNTEEYPISISIKNKYLIIIALPFINRGEGRIMIANEALAYYSTEKISTENSLLIYDEDYNAIKKNEILHSFKIMSYNLIKGFNFDNKDNDFDISFNKKKKDINDLNFPDKSKDKEKYENADNNGKKKESNIDILNSSYPNENEENYNDKENEEINRNINFFDLYNSLTIYSSSINNMRFTSTLNPNEKYYYLLQNYFALPIHIEANKNNDNVNNKYDLNIRTYKPKFSFFGAIDNNLFEIYLYNIFKDGIKEGRTFDFKDFLPLNIRINTDLNLFYDFVNFYFYQFNQKINVYIKKFYGETEIYECNADSINFKDLSILTTPTTNCKDKKSIFNRLFTFDGTKLISGYIGHNSYFDIYIEIEDNRKSITLFPMTNQFYNIASKYLRKNIEYTLDFKANHLVKLEPGFNAEIIIYKNDQEVGKLNSENPTQILEGIDYKIKSNNDAMVYFYGKLFPEIKQIEINANNKGTIQLEIIGNSRYILDFGFLGYSPSNAIDFYNMFEVQDISEQQTYKQININLENIYNKLEVELVKGEHLYIYYLSFPFNTIQVNYLRDNITESDNGYTFHYIPNNKDKSIIINNNYGYFTDIIYQINFCGLRDTKQEVIMSYNNPSNPENNINNQVIKNDKDTYNLNITGFGTKEIKLKSSQDFIFSYSYVDLTDNFFKDNKNWNNERQILNELKIQNIKDENDYSDIISIKFNPNYKQSSTKYIIVIAIKNENNTLENFSNKCYLTKLATIKQKDVIVEKIFDIGEKEFINAEVNVKDISNKNKNEFIIGIISQELRFDKKLNYYMPFSFIHIKKNNNKDDKNKKTIFIILSVVSAVCLIAVAVLTVILVRKKKSINKLRAELDKISFIQDKNDDDDEKKEDNLLE